MSHAHGFEVAIAAFGGALADRFPKRTIIFVCQAVMTASFILLAVLIVLVQLVQSFGDRLARRLNKRLRHA